MVRLWRDTELYLCVPANRSLVVAEYMSNGNGRGIFQCVVQTRFSASYVSQRGQPVLHSDVALNKLRRPNQIKMLVWHREENFTNHEKSLSGKGGIIG